jgi:hypothetical protein
MKVMVVVQTSIVRPQLPILPHKLLLHYLEVGVGVGVGLGLEIGLLVGIGVNLPHSLKILSTQ